MPIRLVLVTLLVLLASPAASAGAQQRWSVDAAATLAKDLRHDNGPTLGAGGVELRAIAPSTGRWSWGGALAWQRFGRFGFSFDPTFHEDRSALIAGVRRRRHDVLTPAMYAELGLSIVVGMEDPSDSDLNRDPGVGTYLGLGLRPPGGGPFVELGVHGIAVSGEKTDVGGVYPMLRVGFSY